MRVVLLEVSLMNFIVKMEGEIGVTRSIIDEIHSSDIERVQMVGKRCVTRSFLDELHPSDIQRDQMEG